MPNITTLNLGPGQIEDGAFEGGRTAGQVLMMGRAEHKRNELAARAFARSLPAWATSIVGLNLSEQARDDLEIAFGSRVDWRENVSEAELRGLFAGSDVFVSLGVEEGFGMPYLEALASGCQVIGIDQQITRTVLGPAGVLLRDGDEFALSSQLHSAQFVDAPTRREKLKQFSWESFSCGVLKVLERASSTRSEAGEVSC